MAKYHINHKGEAGRCSAEKGKCPFGGENEHYDTAQTARVAFEANSERSFSLAGKSRAKRIPGVSKTFNSGEFSIHDLVEGDKIKSNHDNSFRVVRLIDLKNTVMYEGKPHGRVTGGYVGPRGGAQKGHWSALMPLE